MFIEKITTRDYALSELLTRCPESKIPLVQVRSLAKYFTGY